MAKRNPIDKLLRQLGIQPRQQKRNPFRAARISWNRRQQRPRTPAYDHPFGKIKLRMPKQLTSSGWSKLMPR